MENNKKNNVNIIDWMNLTNSAIIQLPEDVLQNMIDMTRKQIYLQHKDEIKKLNTERNQRYYVRLPEIGLVYKTKEEDIIEVLVDYYLGKCTKRTLTTVYEEWCVKRLNEDDVCKNSIRKEQRLWDTYLKDSKIAQMSLAKLDVETLKKWEHDIIKQYSMKRKYFNSISTLLNSLFDYACDLNYIVFNPHTKIKFASKVFEPTTKRASRDEVFSLEERNKVVYHATQDAKDAKSALPLAIPILFGTGLRTGELCALQYGDIEDGYLHIQRMMIEDEESHTYNNIIELGKYNVVPYTKGRHEDGNRFIPLTSQMQEYFRQIKELNASKGFDTSPNAFVFMRATNLAANTRAFDSRLRKYCRKANMKVMKSQHDIRRTFISVLYQKGMSIESIRVLAGHSNIEMTQRYIRQIDTVEDTRIQMEQMLVL